MLSNHILYIISVAVASIILQKIAILNMDEWYKISIDISVFFVLSLFWTFVLERRVLRGMGD